MPGVLKRDLLDDEKHETEEELVKVKKVKTEKKRKER